MCGLSVVDLAKNYLGVLVFLLDFTHVFSSFSNLRIFAFCSSTFGFFGFGFVSFTFVSTFDFFDHYVSKHFQISSFRLNGATVFAANTSEIYWKVIIFGQHSALNYSRFYTKVSNSDVTALVVSNRLNLLYGVVYFGWVFFAFVTLYDFRV